jgi:phosphocarrier protein
VSDAAPTSSDGAPVRRKAVICNRRGLHARAAAKFVKLAFEFNADVMVAKGDGPVSGRSIMGLMMLAAGPGTELELSATGPDAQRAVDALAKLIACGFDES